MDPLALRVAARFTMRLADQGEEEPSGKGGVPPRWQEWLDAVHQSGKEQVPNPNSETRSRYPQVAFSTSLKDKALFKKAIKDYHEWTKKNPERASKPKEEPKSEKAPSKPKPEAKPAPKAPEVKAPKKPAGIAPEGPMKVSAGDLDEIIKKHGADFDKVTATMKAKVAAYSKTYHEDGYPDVGEDVPAFAVKEFEALSESEKMLHIAGHEIGALFLKSLSKEERSDQDMWTNGWQGSSSNGTSTQVHGALSVLGVKGHQTAKDKEKEMYRNAGKKKKDLQQLLGKAYAFTQAYYKHIGLKEVSLFRGVLGKEIEAGKDGDEVEMQTRELSSFTSDPKIAAAFGRPVKMKVPVENILWSNLTCPMFAGKDPPGRGEAEIAVMGASAIPGKIVGASHVTIEVEGR